MTTIDLGGPVTSAVTHMALAGLAAIVQDRAGVVPRMCWVETSGVRAHLTIPNMAESEIGTLVGDHAARHAKPESWVSADIDHHGRPTAAFSPRIKPPATPAQWKALQQARHQGIDAVMSGTGTELDLRFIQALGEPAYWRFAPNGPRPDEGASRWEMKARNRGEEFVGNRLRLLAAAVADRDSHSVINGLTGIEPRDECGKDKQDSRSATGLSRPRPTDNALAWCALWGIAQFPVAQQVDGRSVTAGYLPGNRENGYRPAVIIPVPVRPITPARFRALVRTSELTSGGVNGMVNDGPRAQSRTALEWFRVRGIGALMRFPVERVGSTSAPENRLLDGVMIRIGGRPT